MAKIKQLRAETEHLLARYPQYLENNKSLSKLLIIRIVTAMFSLQKA